jgi:2-polyprenyl-3-methyl-5-hydroxy-6-metoxy-1,4-benzoquinol methylase
MSNVMGAVADGDRLVEVACPNCGSRSRAPWAEERGFTLTKCADCGLLYVSPRLRDDLIDQAVRSGVHAEEAQNLVVTARRDSNKVERYRKLFTRMFADLWVRPSVSWLDVGAGYGEVIEAVRSLAPRDSLVRGLEPMHPKAQSARLRGLDIEEAYLSPEHGPFDVVSTVDVFSHIPDFNAFLSVVRQVVRPGGDFFLETGNLADVSNRNEFADELGLPDHLVFAGESQLTQFLSRAGFEIVEIDRQRIDTPLFFAKTVAKKLLGRPAVVRLPYSSGYRSLRIRARRSG